jgi:transposase-like protein
LPSKSLAAELGIHEHTVGKWRRRFLMSIRFESFPHFRVEC